MQVNWRNPQFTADGRIDCEIEHPEFGWIPFTVDPADAGAAIDTAALDAAIRAAGDIAPYVPPPGPTIDDAWAALRAERNARLAASDWTQVADAPVDAAAWAAYRQALRDMPENTADPFAPVWPATPA
jgi:hypothetical protein